VVKKLITVIGIIYLALYGTFLSTYHLPTPKTALGTYIAELQWAIPSVLLIFFVLFPVPKKIKILTIKNVSIVGFVVLFISIILQLFGVSGIWWSWDTMGLLIIIVLGVMLFNQGKLKDSDSILLSLSAMFIGFGIFEIIYQIGVLKFDNFFGANPKNFWIVMMELFFWIFPSFFTINYLHSIYKNIWNFNRYALISLGLAAIFGIIWFTNGFAIPIMWVGTTPYFTQDSALFISISRYCQAFLTIGIALIFVPIRGWKLVEPSKKIA
jgi:hypothetical protein